MGTGCAPPMLTCTGGGECDLFSKEERAAEFSNILSRHCYIDNVFMVWAGSKDESNVFLESLQHNSYNLKFTYSYSQEKIKFLGVEIFLNDVRTLCSTLYRKPSAGNTLLHATSSHPKQPIRSILYSQYLRLRCNCTLEEDFTREAVLLCESLLVRGYSRTCLRKTYNKVRIQDRNTLIYKPRRKTQSGSTRIVTKYNRQHGKVRNV